MTTRTRFIAWYVALALASGQFLMAQDVAPALNFQRADNSVVGSARARAMGSAAVAAGNDATAMFVNPAILGDLSAFEIRLGGQAFHPVDGETQEWHPTRLYAELSLLLENRMGGIINQGQDSAAVALKHAYDNLGPDWKRSADLARPSLAAAALPLANGTDKLVVGLGYAEMMNLNYYFQNNNALDPNIGQMRPSPVARLTSKNDSLPVQWFHYIAQREGGVYGITPSIGFGFGEHFRLGIAATILTGKTDDREDRVMRGLITLRANSASTYNVFSVDSIDARTLRSGTSTFSGTMLNIGLLWKGESYSAGLSIKPAYTLVRDWERTVRADSMGSSATYTETGTDKLQVPAIVSVGLAIYPSERVVVGMDYEFRGYGSSTMLLNSDTTIAPWVNTQVFRLGGEYRAARWLKVRLGYREDVQAIVPAGAAILDDPVRGSVYSAGLGFTFGPWAVDLAYEYGVTQFYDAWESNINYQTHESHNLTVECGYRF